VLFGKQIDNFGKRLIQAIFSFLSLWSLFCRHAGKMKLYQQICAIKPAGASQRV